MTVQLLGNVMINISFEAFSNELRDIQTDSETPVDYLETRAAMLYKFAGLGFGKPLVNAGQRMLGSRAGQAIARHAEPLAHGAEVAGLGILAAPSIGELRHSGAAPQDRTKAKAELAGLGVLAAPSAMSLGKHLITRH